MDIASLLQMMMAGGMGDNTQTADNAENTDNADGTANSDNAESASNAGDFSGFFENIDIDMVMKMGEVFAQLNKPDKNADLLSALKPHLRDENQHKVDTAMKLSRMITLLPFLKESGILKNLF
ncbi:MAG: hypothetical protein FWG45_04650 [Oscillospiraceae bacterium]|nr:hypothetical protein [Oscillospiraceae bacterium]